VPAYSASALGAWSLVHGFASLLMTGNFPPAVAADPEGALREVAKQVHFGPVGG
jgi:hypothetical protein